MGKSIALNHVSVVAEMCRQDLTVEELAQRAGVGRSAVNKARTGGRIWRTTAQHIAAGLGVPLETLRDYPQPMKEGTYDADGHH